MEGIKYGGEVGDWQGDGMAGSVREKDVEEGYTEEIRGGERECRRKCKRGVEEMRGGERVCVGERVRERRRREIRGGEYIYI